MFICKRKKKPEPLYWPAAPTGPDTERVGYWYISIFGSVRAITSISVKRCPLDFTAHLPLVY